MKRIFLDVNTNGNNLQCTEKFLLILIYYEWMKYKYNLIFYCSQLWHAMKVYKWMWCASQSSEYQTEFMKRLWGEKFSYSCTWKTFFLVLRENIARIREFYVLAHKYQWKYFFFKETLKMKIPLHTTSLESTAVCFCT